MCYQSKHCFLFTIMVVAYGLNCPMACDSSWTRDWTCVPCIDRQIPNHWEVQQTLLYINICFFFHLIYINKYPTGTTETKAHFCCGMYNISTSFLFMTELYAFTTCLFTHQLMDIWVSLTFWLLWVMLIGAFVYKFLCGYMFTGPLNIYLGVGLMGHIVTIFNIKNYQTVF